ncbi:MAG TPA: hypothetical protein DGF10_01785 [Acidimicrobiaceae bacterium]|nr:hypothetical protein [Acidimicrobiaceae bacterium]HAQ23217.1 hypothetical protein [Acidimicrobiaceae bacterium]HCV33371.1 hypothetical protein [Acidimicrobiaceae bacterium]
MTDYSAAWPAPDAAKLAAQFAEWTAGETLVGRMLSNLKTGRLPDLLSDAADGPHSDAVATVSAHWQGWEQGTVVPLVVAEGLRDDGLEALLADLASSAAGADG